MLWQTGTMVNPPLGVGWFDSTGPGSRVRHRPLRFRVTTFRTCASVVMRMPSEWEGNRGSDVTLAMRHSGLSTYSSQGLRKG